MKKRSSNQVSLGGFSVLFTYVCFISWRLFFYAYSNNYRGQMSSISYNLVPFKTIMNYIKHSNYIGFDIWIYNLAGNVAAFMPLGFLLPWAFRGFKMAKTFAISFVMIFSAELLQLVSRRGVFDVDDLLLNMMGSMVGYIFYKVLERLLRR